MPMMILKGSKISALSLGFVAFGLIHIAIAQTSALPRATQVSLLSNWLVTHRGAQSKLPQSHVGDHRFIDWCFTYDSAVAALAFVAMDQPAEARPIIDFYISKKNFHRLGGIIEALTVVYPYEGKDWSVRTGANIWLGLASFHLFKSTNDITYLDFAVKLADFALGLQDRDTTRNTYGGIKLGPPGDPAHKGDQHFGYDPDLPGYEEVFSTEAAIDAFALFNLLQQEPGMDRFREGRDRCLVWLKKSAWNPVDLRFNRGFHREPDFSVASDIQAWGISALGAVRLNAIAPGAAEQMIAFVEKNCQSTVTYDALDGQKITLRGFDFVDHGARMALKRPPLVSPEWSFQMANAYKRLADDFSARGENKTAGIYRQKQKDILQQVMTMAEPRDNALAFPYATLADAPVGHENFTPAKGNLSMTGVTYGILALTGFDPLRSSDDVNRSSSK